MTDPVSTTLTAPRLALGDAKPAFALHLNDGRGCVDKAALLAIQL